MGARMTGGGFGGCTVNVVLKENAESFREAVRQAYRSGTGTTPEVYMSMPSEGAGPLKLDS